ncbi:hypothetical protein IRJ41_009086, partial [Triplophysa rosa]
VLQGVDWCHWRLQASVKDVDASSFTMSHRELPPGTMDSLYKAAAAAAAALNRPQICPFKLCAIPNSPLEKYTVLPLGSQPNARTTLTPIRIHTTAPRFHSALHTLHLHVSSEHLSEDTDPPSTPPSTTVHRS